MTKGLESVWQAMLEEFPNTDKGADDYHQLPKRIFDDLYLNDRIQINQHHHKH